MDLGEAVATTGPDPESYWQVGVVTGTSGAKVVVTVNGVSHTMSYLDWYTPVNTDVVMIAWPEGRPFCLGRLNI
jgi:hypothetical protein